jgi:hypothetical protein
MYSVNSMQMCAPKYWTYATFWINRWIIPGHMEQPLDHWLIVCAHTPLGPDVYCFSIL